MDLEFDIDPEIFHERKRRRITEINNREPPPLKTAPTSLPGIHEIATFLPGRLEFEHEIDNEAEDMVKDLEFGVVSEYGGDQMIEDEDDLDVKARAKWLEDRRLGLTTGLRDPPVPAGKGYMTNGAVNGYHPNGDVKKLKSEDSVTNIPGSVDDEAADEAIHPQPYETKESLTFKLTLLEMYFQRVEKRLESKAIIFDRGLLEYKKVCRSICVEASYPQCYLDPSDRKETTKGGEGIFAPFSSFCSITNCGRLRGFYHRHALYVDSPYSNWFILSTDALFFLDEALLRKRIQELQQYRRLGLSTPADIEKYDLDLAKRVCSPILLIIPYVFF